MIKQEDGTEVEVFTKTELEQLVEESTSALKANRDEILAERKKAKEKLEEEEKLRAEKEQEIAKKNGDYEKLSLTLETKLAEKAKEHEELISSIKEEKVNNSINKVVNELGAGGALNEDLADLLKARFSFDYDMENSSVRVQGDGVADIEQLIETVKNSGRYDHLLAGSKATGGGADGSTGGTGKKASEMTEKEKVTLYRTNPERYKQLFG